MKYDKNTLLVESQSYLGVIQLQGAAGNVKTNYDDGLTEILVNIVS